MKTKQYKKLVAAILLGAVSLSTVAHAEKEGNGVGGGGLSFGGSMLDLEMVKGKIDIKKDSAYEKTYLPMKSMLSQCVPEFINDGITGTYENFIPWYGLERKLLSVRDKSKVPVTADQMAVHRGFYIVVDKNLYKKAPQESRGVLYVHEFFQTWRSFLNQLLEDYQDSDKTKNEGSGVVFIPVIKRKIPAENVELMTVNIYDTFLKWRAAGSKYSPELCESVKNTINGGLGFGSESEIMSREDGEKIKKYIFEFRKIGEDRCLHNDNREVISRELRTNESRFDAHTAEEFEHLRSDLKYPVGFTKDVDNRCEKNKCISYTLKINPETCATLGQKGARSKTNNGSIIEEEDKAARSAD